jgi:hypothetical protein
MLTLSHLNARTGIEAVQNRTPWQIYFGLRSSRVIKRSPLQSSMSWPSISCFADSICGLVVGAIKQDGSEKMAVDVSAQLFNHISPVFSSGPSCTSVCALMHLQISAPGRKGYSFSRSAARARSGTTRLHRPNWTQCCRLPGSNAVTADDCPTPIYRHDDLPRSRSGPVKTVVVCPSAKSGK